MARQQPNILDSFNSTVPAKQYSPWWGT